MPTTEKTQYIDKLNELAKRYGSVEDQVTRDILRFLNDTRQQITAQLVTAGTPASQFQLQQLRQNIDRLIAEFEQKANARLRAAFDDAYNLGGLSAVEPLRKLGFESVFFSPSKAQINILQAFTADLVKDITEDARKLINRNVRMAALGQISPFDAMRGITGEMGQERGQVVGGVSARAETVIRTEMQRVFNLSNFSQQQLTAERIPGLKKRWIATGDGRTRRGHLEVHLKTKDNPIPANEKFIVRNWRYSKGVWHPPRETTELMYPGDPSGPGWAVINCRCSMATIHPAIGTIGSSLDGRVGAMMKRAEEQ